jgi:4,5-DOPA dioxygenase extradiol
VLVDGYAYGSLSMTAYTIGVACPVTTTDRGAPLPPATTPPDESNI